MDRVKSLRVESGGTSDVSGSSEAGFQTAEDTAAGSKYFSFTDDDSYVGTPPKSDKLDVLGQSTPRPAISDSEFGAGLSPISQTDALYGQIDARKILSGGIDIFEDCGSNDGDGLVIDDDAVNTNDDVEKVSEKVICEPNESANLSVSSDDAAALKDIHKSLQIHTDGTQDTETIRGGGGEEETTNNEVFLQIDGKIVDALDIGNGLHLYRKVDSGELNAIQILQEEGQPPNFKFLKVRQIGESDLEVYEEQIKEVPMTAEELEEHKRKENKEELKLSQKSKSHLPISDVKKALSHESSISAKALALTTKANKIETNKIVNVLEDLTQIPSADKITDGIGDSKINPLRNIECSRKSPILGNFTSMTLHSSSNKDGVPPTKTMINLPLSAGRNSDIIKKTIEVSTDNSNLKCVEKTTDANLSSKSHGQFIDIPKKSQESIKELSKKEDINKVTNNADCLSLFDSDHSNISSPSVVKTTHFPLKTNEDFDEKMVSNNTRIECSDVQFKEIKNDEKIYTKLNVMENKRDFNTTKQNVVSKWVLRSDSTEEKCKKERDKASLESKPISSCNKLTNDISTKKDINKSNDVTNQNMDSTANVISNYTLKVDRQESKDKPEKICSKSLQMDYSKTSIFGESSKHIPLPVNNEQKIKSFDLNTQGYIKKNVGSVPTQKTETHDKNSSNKDSSIKKETTNAEVFMNKYISQAYKTTFLGKKNLMTKLDTEAGTNITPFSSSISGVKANVSTLHVDVESANKPVPFGKWTEGDKQQYLNKLKDQKLPSTNPALSPAKSYHLATVKNDMKRRELKKSVKPESFENVYLSKIHADLPSLKTEEKPNKDVDMKGLIDTTITGLIMKTLLGPAGQPPVLNHPSITTAHASTTEKKLEHSKVENLPPTDENHPVKENIAAAVNLNEKAELSKVERGILPVRESLSDKVNKIPKLLPMNTETSKIEPSFNKLPLQCNEEEESEDEIIDNEPVTGDMQWSNSKGNQKVTIAEIQKMIDSKSTRIGPNINSPKCNNKPGTVNEIEFDKNIGNKSTNQVDPISNNSIVVEALKPSNLTEIIETNTKSLGKSNCAVTEKPMQIKSIKTPNLLGHTRPLHSQIPQAVHPSATHTKSHSDTLKGNTLISDNPLTYHSKLQMAYQSALSAKNLKESPVKVLDSQAVKTSSFSSKLEQVQNVPTTKQNVQAIGKIQDSVIAESEKKVNEEKVSDMLPNVKSKHQRKQVLTSVETPPIEIIESDKEVNETILKKKRKIEYKPIHTELEPDNVSIEIYKPIAPKKDYLLGRASAASEDNVLSNKKDDAKNINQTGISSILENSNEKLELNLKNPIPHVEHTPKRGRGRPRKCLSETKPKADAELIVNSSESDSFDKNSSTTSVDDEGDSDEEGIIRENWTMGKINEKIVCPICNKLFRSESIVFKHVKHCSTLEKSPSKRLSTVDNIFGNAKKGRSEDSQNSQFNVSEEQDKSVVIKEIIEKKFVGKNNNEVDPNIIVLDTPNSSKIIVIDDSPMPVDNKVVKANENITKVKQSISTGANRSLPANSTQPTGNKIGRPRSTTTNTCEICGKTFRQLSYLVHHRLQHKNDFSKQLAESTEIEKKPILSCEVCRKEFRKLHHLVEHREIHNISSITNSSLQRKNSVDKTEQKKEPEPTPSKNVSKPDEHTAGFRCEPCDKSFRKLYHLVEHRETHDGMNRQKNSPPQVSQPEKATIESPTCEVCGKSFRKLHHLIEHREQHLEANVEKRERKSLLLTKDIIHECSLCYMVFPNEPSLNKHFINCQKKKKASVTVAKTEKLNNDEVSTCSGVKLKVDIIPEGTDNAHDPIKLSTTAIVDAEINEKDLLKSETQADNREKTDKLESETLKSVKNKKIIKSGIAMKKPAKIGITVQKRGRNSLAPVPEVEDNIVKGKESDDEERYMINPSYREDSDDEKEIFMNVCVAKRNSLNFDSPSAEAEFKKRRTSLQHPPKANKIVSKKLEHIPPNVPSDSKANKSTKLDKRSNASVPSNSISANNSVKYSFPISDKPQKLPNKTDIPEPGPKTLSAKLLKEERARKVERRKSLTGIAKRKSLGKGAKVKPAATAKGEPSTAAKKEVKKQVNHVCDCGAPFTSATLLAQHTSVAHTPPRIRRPRPAPPASKLRRIPKHSGVPVGISKSIDK